MYYKSAMHICHQIKRTSTQQVTNLFSKFIDILIKQDVEQKVMNIKFLISNFQKNIGETTKFMK